MEVVRRYIFPPSSYPRYRYATLHIKRLINDSQTLIHKCDIPFSPPVPSFDNVVVDVFSGKDEELIAENLLEYKSSRQKEVETFSLSEYTNSASKNEVGTHVCIISYKEFIANGPPEFPGCLTVLLVEKDADPSLCQLQLPGDEIIISTTELELSKEISNLLERYVFSFLKERATVLQCLSVTATFNTLKIGEQAGIMAKSDLSKDPLADERKFTSVWVKARKKAWLSEVSKQYTQMPKAYRQSLLEQEKTNFDMKKLRHCLCEDLTPVIGTGE